MLSRLRAFVARHHRPALLAGVLVGIVVTVGGGYVALSRFTTLSVVERLTAAGIVANAVLTFGLLWVYTEMADVEARQADVQERQTEIQRRQTDIQERQEAWMEANHAPVVRVERFGSVPLGSDDGCRVTVRNDGNGLAKGVCLRWEVRVGDDALHLDAQGDVTGVRWLDPNGEDFELVDPDDPSPLVRRQKTASGRPMASGNPVLGAGERAKLFVGATFRPTDVVALDPDAVPSLADEGAMGMSELFDALAADGFAEARVTVRLSARNVVGERTTEAIAAGPVAIEPGLTVGEVARAVAPDANSDGG